MRSDYDFPRPELVGPVVFRPDFNGDAVISASQAWSLFFTAGNEDKALGFGLRSGRLFTDGLIALGAIGILWATFTA